MRVNNKKYLYTLEILSSKKKKQEFKNNAISIAKI